MAKRNATSSTTVHPNGARFNCNESGGEHSIERDSMKRSKSLGFFAISVTIMLAAMGQFSATAASSYTYTSDQATLSAGINGDAVTAKLGDVNPSGKKYKIAVVLKALTNQYWQGIEQGVKAAAAQYNVTVVVQAATSESDPNEQLGITQTLVAQGFDAYVIAPQTTSNLNPAIEQMKKAGAPIVNVDDARIPATTYVGPDHKLDGTQAAKTFAALWVKSGGQVAQIEGQAGSSAAQLRIAGFKEGIAKQKNLMLVASVPGDWDANKAYAAAQQIIQKYPKLKGIYANNDTMAIGVAKAVSESGKKILVIGTDGVPEAVSGVRNGTVYATVSPLPFYEGYWALTSAIRLLEGQKLPAWVISPAQLITKQNVSKFYDKKGMVLGGLFK